MLNIRATSYLNRACLYITRNVSTIHGCPYPRPGHDPGVTVRVKGLDVGKYHTTFQLSSSEGINLLNAQYKGNILPESSVFIYNSKCVHNTRMPLSPPRARPWGNGTSKRS